MTTELTMTLGDADDGRERHRCEGVVEGDWMVFRCEQCLDYERRIHRCTGEMKLLGTRSEIIHYGNATPLDPPGPDEPVN